MTVSNYTVSVKLTKGSGEIDRIYPGQYPGNKETGNP